MNETILKVESVSKKFCRDLKRSLWYGMEDLGNELLGRSLGKNGQLRKGEFWALHQVNFELKRGESIGLIGANGAGKTTLLRIISGLIKPDQGSVKIKGIVAPMIALGAGFNPILTGRENIYVNMTILGLSKVQIDDRMGAVVSFAEIGEALDAPVQSYSSGMLARLGFACAIHVEPEILLIDEVLAVGDIAFRGKCYRKLSELRKNGVTFILVSHNPTAMLGVCESSLYLSKGIVIEKGNTEDVVRKYEDDIIFDKSSKMANGILHLPPKKEDIGIKVRYICFADRNGNILESVTTGHYARLFIGCHSCDDYDAIGVGISVRDLTRESDIVLHMTSHFDNKHLSISKGDAEIQIEMNCCSLRQGKYDLKLGLYKMPPPDMFDAVESFVFQVNSPTDFRHTASKNLFYQPRRWKVVCKR